MIEKNDTCCCYAAYVQLILCFAEEVALVHLLPESNI